MPIGKADIEEATALIAFIRPFAGRDSDLDELLCLLEDIAADGVVEPRESEALAAAVAHLHTKYA